MASVTHDEPAVGSVVGGDAKPLPFIRLLSYADAVDWVLMGLGTLGSVVHGMAQPVGYLLLGRALDAFGNNISDERAMVRALYKVVPFVWYMAIATLPAGMLEISCWMYSSERQLAHLRLAFLKAVLNQDIEAFDTDLTTAQVISGMTTHMSVIQDAIGEKLGHSISSFSTFLVGILIAFFCCWEVALLALLVVPLILAIGATYTKKMNTLSSLRMTYTSEATAIVEQTLSHIKTVFSFVGESSSVKYFSSCMEKQYVMSKKEAVIKGLGLGSFQAVTFCSWALIVWVGAVVVTAKRAKGGDVIAAVMSVLFGAISITYAAPDFQIFNQAKAAGSEVFKVIKQKPGISYETKGQILEKVAGEIDIKEVHFAYPSRQNKPILQNFSLFVPAGKIVALVGSSGCGKSTVISLVQRFYNPTSGSIMPPSSCVLKCSPQLPITLTNPTQVRSKIAGGIFVDGYNVKDLDLKFLRRNIAAVSQEPSLFAGTIKDNLKIGKMEASDEDIVNAASTANAHSFISQLPYEYSTELGERGMQLSGGQKQRVAIARAVLKDPPILLLDEATSALDSESEKLVQDALEKAMQGRTVILIAHRMSTVVNSDIIVVVENGRVAQSGTHKELLETSKYYSNVFNMQNVEKEAGQTETRARDHSKEAEQTIERSQMQAFKIHEHCKKPDEEPTKVPTHGREVQRKTIPFFRIWFKLHNLEVAKTAVGSVAAAVSGISKPLFGFFIMTIGVSYYRQDARSRVGRYSMIFCLVGLIMLVSHTLQHYLYGLVGEMAMKSLREALFSGNI
ncbi:ABC transporter B family member 19-like [Typha angustifolia]|uniref:ABC transporter B family member 19-like n=1 Tax=Typha angustifolia TaxID=59011 RepID=UPI003C2B23B0